MNKQEIANQINALIVERDENGADVQDAIDSLFSEFESLCDYSDSYAAGAYEETMSRMG